MRRNDDETSSVLEIFNDAKLRKTEHVFETAYQLQRQKASEVLAFLLSDFDRFMKKDTEHSIPIDFAFKGLTIRNDII